MKPHWFLCAIVALAFPSAAISAELTGEKVPASVEKVLKEILDAADIPTAKITSFERSHSEQAATMFTYYLKPGASGCAGKKDKDGKPSCKCDTFDGRATCAKGVYCDLGDQAIDLVKETDAEPEAVRKMSHHLNKILKPERTCLMHVRTDPAGPNYAVDISPTSLKGKDKAFIEQVEANKTVVQSRFFRPGKHAEAAYHIEIPRD